MHTIRFLFVLLFWASLSGLAFYQYKKRVDYQKLYIQNHIEPQWLKGMLPPFTVESKRGKKVSFTPQKDRWILLHFWATWCPACIKEMPFLGIFAQHFYKRLRVVAISEDDNWDDIEAFLGKNGFSFEVYLDTQGQLAESLHITRYPETFLISPKGRLVLRISGARDWSKSEMNEFIESVLSQQE